MPRSGTPHAAGRMGPLIYVSFLACQSHSTGTRGMCDYPLLQKKKLRDSGGRKASRISVSSPPSSPVGILAPVDRAAGQGHTAGEQRLGESRAGRLIVTIQKAEVV